MMKIQARRICFTTSSARMGLFILQKKLCIFFICAFSIRPNCTNVFLSVFRIPHFSHIFAMGFPAFFWVFNRHKYLTPYTYL